MKFSLLVLTLACSTLGYAKPLDLRDDTHHNNPLAPRTIIAAAPTSSCAVSLVTPVPTNLHCEQTGVIARPETLVPGSTIPKAVPTPFIACRNACLANRKCISFSYAAGSRTCQEYSRPLSGMGFKQSTVKGAVKAAFRHCYKQTCATTTTTTTSTSTSTTPAPSPCIPTPSPLLTNPSFETVSADKSVPPWQTQGSVSFVSDSAVATDGTYYADITAPGGSTSVLSQSLSGLTDGQNYILNVTYNVLQLPSSGGYCFLRAGLNVYNVPYVIVTNGVSTNGNFLASVQAMTATDTFSLTLDCSESGSGAKVAIDNVRLLLPDPSCLMTIQAVDPSNASGVDGQYLVNSRESDEDSTIFFSADSTQATQYSLDQYGNVYWTTGRYSSYAYWAQGILAQPSNAGYDWLKTDPLVYIDGGMHSIPPYYEYVKCSIDPVTLLMSCTAYGQTFLGTDGSFPTLGNKDQSEAAGTLPIQLKVSYLTYNPSSGS